MKNEVKNIIQPTATMKICSHKNQRHNKNKRIDQIEEKNKTVMLMVMMSAPFTLLSSPIRLLKPFVFGLQRVFVIRIEILFIISFFLFLLCILFVKG